MDICDTSSKTKSSTPSFTDSCKQENSPLKGGRGSASLVAKCKMCSRENSLDIIADSIASYDTNGAFKTIVVFDCRGLEPVDFSPRVCRTKCSSEL